MIQSELFEEKQLTGREKALAEFVDRHPFQYHRLIVRNGIAAHHNSLYKGYNATDEELKECDMPFTKRVICNTTEELLNVISNSPATNKQTLYILTNLDWSVVKSVLGSNLHDNT